MNLSSPARSIVALAVAGGLLIVFSAVEARAHGIWGHIHVTGWAIEELPDGPLEELMAEPEVMNAALFGASFPDSGYFPIQGKDDENARAYAEFTHWEPFIHRFIEWIRTEDPPPWDDLESRKRVAFLMGCAAHGLQDEIFDSLYLDHSALHEGGSQEEVDPGTDGFLALEGQLRFIPEPWIPLETLLVLYGELDAEITTELIETAAGAMTDLYINDGFGLEFAASLGEAYEEQLPWSRAHFMDPKVMGSLASEVGPTGAYLQAIWKRLHDGLGTDETVAATMPPSPWELETGASAELATRVTWVYGVGVHRHSAWATCVDAAGDPVSGSMSGTRWDAEYTRLHSFTPDGDLLVEGETSCTLDAGLLRIDELASEAPHEITLRIPCWSPSTMTCDEPEPEPDPEPTPTPTPTPTPEANAGDSAGCSGGVAPPWALLVLIGGPLVLLRRRARRSLRM